MMSLQDEPDSALKRKNNASISTKDTNSINKKFVTSDDSKRQYSFTVTASIDSLLQKKVTPEEYIKQQKEFSSDKKAGYFERIITVKLLKINLEGEAGKKEFFKTLISKFFHNIPKMLFFLLPVFALWLKLLYIRRKQFYFVDHAILSLHYFSFIFMLLKALTKNSVLTFQRCLKKIGTVLVYR